MGFDFAQHHALLRVHPCCTDQFRRIQMTKGSVDSQPNAIGSHPVSPENEKQAAERRWLEDAWEDDEVYEALVSLRAEQQAKNNS
jgi:hypothetical protein